MTINRRHTTATPAGIDTNIYASGDLLGGKLTFADALGARRGGTLVSVVVRDLAKQDSAMDLILFDSDPAATTFTNNAALAIADADLPKVIGHVSFATGDWAGESDNGFATKANVNLSLVAPGAALYGALVSRGTPTYAAAGDLSVTIAVLLD